MAGFQKAPPVEKAHGERRTYAAGCRCSLCRAANAEYFRNGSLYKRQADEIENLRLKLEVTELKLAALQASGERVSA